MDILVTHVSTNKRGQPQRDSQRVAGPTLNIGRGAQCQIHLPDPRVALEHARITVAEGGASIAAEPGRILVNGRAVDGCRLAVGDRIEAGPYVIEVEKSPTGIVLALAVTLTEPLQAGFDGRRYKLQPPRLSKRRLAYLSFIGVLVLCLLVPIAPDLLGTRASVAKASPKRDNEMINAAAAQVMQAWNPGTLSESHQTFGDDCQIGRAHV